MFIDEVMQRLQAAAMKGDEASTHYLATRREAERFHIDTIAKYMHETFLPEVDGPMDFDVPHQIPTLAPVASVMWFEMHGDLWERGGSMRSGCLLVVAHDTNEDGVDGIV